MLWIFIFWVVWIIVDLVYFGYYEGDYIQIAWYILMILIFQGGGGLSQQGASAGRYLDGPQDQSRASSLGTATRWARRKIVRLVHYWYSIDSALQQYNVVDNISNSNTWSGVLFCTSDTNTNILILTMIELNTTSANTTNTSTMIRVYYTTLYFVYYEPYATLYYIILYCIILYYFENRFSGAVCRRPRHIVRGVFFLFCYCINSSPRILLLQLYDTFFCDEFFPSHHVMSPCCRCAEDEKLLGFYRRKGKQTEPPRVPPFPRDTASPPPGRSNNRRLSFSLPKPAAETRDNRRSTVGPNASPRLDNAAGSRAGRSGSLARPAEPGKENAPHERRNCDAGGNKSGANRNNDDTEAFSCEGNGKDGGQKHGDKAKAGTSKAAASGKAKSGDKGGSFLEFVGMSSWTPPWSVTRVSVQQPEEQQRPGTGDGDKHATSRGKQQQQQPPPQQQQQKQGLEEAGSKERAGGFPGGVYATAGKGREGTGGSPPQLCVLDARTAVSAMGNQLVGKGVETGAG